MLLALSLTPAVSMAQAVVRIAPPVPMREHPGPAPRPGWVWIEGHHQWDGHHYVWVHGYWVRPPHEGAVWVAHHWVQRNGGWVLIEGHWR